MSQLEDRILKFLKETKVARPDVISIATGLAVSPSEVGMALKTLVERGDVLRQSGRRFKSGPYYSVASQRD